MAIAFPRVALTDGRSGAAVIRCVVDADGHLDPCAVLGEKPIGEGFASAALELAKRFQMQVKDRSGAPTPGRTIRIPIYFLVP
jgi:TonB family protein